MRRALAVGSLHKLTYPEPIRRETSWTSVLNVLKALSDATSKDKSRIAAKLPNS